MRRQVQPGLLWVLGALLALWIWCPYKLSVVLGASMTPTLRSGQVILIDRVYYRSHPVQRGDIIAFRQAGPAEVKRVYGLPGDRVWEVRSRDGENVFLADPGKLERTRLAIASLTAEMKLVVTRVPEGRIYVIGDGGNTSNDSRYYGPVPRQCLLGRVRARSREALTLQEATQRVTLVLTSRRGGDPVASSNEVVGGAASGTAAGRSPRVEHPLPVKALAAAFVADAGSGDLIWQRGY
ncbi:MAG: signal peptidase I [Armatimonadetes bacterium]|nr:signal peptidase I [Armatimonadota bacterium]